MNNLGLLSFRIHNFDINKLLGVLSKEKIGFLLESSNDVYNLGRYSFFGISPFLIIQSKDGLITEDFEARRSIFRGDIFEELKKLLEEYRIDTNSSKISFPFIGGAVGYFSYDLGFFLEKIKRKNPDDLSIPDAWFGLFDVVLCIDHYRDCADILSTGFPKRTSRERRKHALARIDELVNKLDSPYTYRNKDNICQQYPLVSNFSYLDYVDKVDRALSYITKGDIYQVNLCQRFSTLTEKSAEELYFNLRQVFPVPFGGILKTGNFEIISGSPERFLRFDGRFLSTRPMKGTRPRSDNDILDRRLKRELENSNKDKAELLMIVDLERNDLGKICKYRTIKVKNLRMIEQYSSVYQATAQIEGELFSKYDRIDAIKACFPGGSITGCPKIRAMEIIEELESVRRNIYTGSMGYLSFCGKMDFNILIRSFLKKGRNIYFGVGGGIVFDSKPELEYQEILDKAKCLISALRAVSYDSVLVAR